MASVSEENSDADSDVDETSVEEEYKSSLEDLNFNSKPLINVLTMLADENISHADIIINLIASRIKKVTIDKKMPSLYLIDSILKNVGRGYIGIISKYIVDVFTNVFEKGDEKVRLALFKLRNTWPQYFPNKVLYDLDIKVHQLDSNWPITASPPAQSMIHINPKFLKKSDEEKSSSNEEVKKETAAQEEAENRKRLQEQKLREEERKIQQQLKALQEEQLRLQRQRLEEQRQQKELLLKKQQEDREKVIEEQHKQIEALKRQQGQEKAASSSTHSEPMVATRSSTRIPKIQESRDPRLARRQGLHDKKHGVTNKPLPKQQDILSQSKVSISETTVKENETGRSRRAVMDPRLSVRHQKEEQNKHDSPKKDPKKQLTNIKRNHDVKEAEKQNRNMPSVAHEKLTENLTKFNLESSAISLASFINSRSSRATAENVSGTDKETLIVSTEAKQIIPQTSVKEDSDNRTLHSNAKLESKMNEVNRTAEASTSTNLVSNLVASPKRITQSLTLDKRKLEKEPKSKKKMELVTSVELSDATPNWPKNTVEQNIQHQDLKANVKPLTSHRTEAINQENVNHSSGKGSSASIDKIVGTTSVEMKQNETRSNKKISSFSIESLLSTDVKMDVVKDQITQSGKPATENIQDTQFSDEQDVKQSIDEESTVKAIDNQHPLRDTKRERTETLEQNKKDSQPPEKRTKLLSSEKSIDSKESVATEGAKSDTATHKPTTETEEHLVQFVSRGRQGFWADPPLKTETVEKPDDSFIERNRKRSRKEVPEKSGSADHQNRPAKRIADDKYHHSSREERRYRREDINDDKQSFKSKENDSQSDLKDTKEAQGSLSVTKAAVLHGETSEGRRDQRKSRRLSRSERALKKEISREEKKKMIPAENELPPDLRMSHHQDLVKQIERRLKSGDLTEEQHKELIRQLDMLFEMQKSRELIERRRREAEGQWGRSNKEQLQGERGQPMTDRRRDYHDRSHPERLRPPPEIMDTSDQHRHSNHPDYASDHRDRVERQGPDLHHDSDDRFSGRKRIRPDERKSDHRGILDDSDPKLLSWRHNELHKRGQHDDQWDSRRRPPPHDPQFRMHDSSQYVYPGRKQHCDIPPPDQNFESRQFSEPNYPPGPSHVPHSEQYVSRPGPPVHLADGAQQPVSRDVRPAPDQEKASSQETMDLPPREVPLSGESSSLDGTPKQLHDNSIPPQLPPYVQHDRVAPHEPHITMPPCEPHHSIPPETSHRGLPSDVVAQPLLLPKQDDTPLEAQVSGPSERTAEAPASSFGKNEGTPTMPNDTEEVQLSAGPHPQQSLANKPSQTKLLEAGSSLEKEVSDKLVGESDDLTHPSSQHENEEQSQVPTHAICPPETALDKTQLPDNHDNRDSSGRFTEEPLHQEPFVNRPLMQRPLDDRPPANRPIVDHPAPVGFDDRIPPAKEIEHHAGGASIDRPFLERPIQSRPFQEGPFFDRPAHHQHDRPPHDEQFCENLPPQGRFDDRPPQQGFFGDDSLPDRHLEDRPPQGHFDKTPPPHEPFNDGPPAHEPFDNRPQPFSNRQLPHEPFDNRPPPREPFGDRPLHEPFDDRPPLEPFDNRPHEHFDDRLQHETFDNRPPGYYCDRPPPEGRFGRGPVDDRPPPPGYYCDRRDIHDYRPPQPDHYDSRPPPPVHFDDRPPLHARLDHRPPPDAQFDDRPPRHYDNPPHPEQFRPIELGRPHPEQGFPDRPARDRRFHDGPPFDQNERDRPFQDNRFNDGLPPHDFDRRPREHYYPERPYFDSSGPSRYPADQYREYDRRDMPDQFGEPRYMPQQRYDSRYGRISPGPAPEFPGRPPEFNGGMFRPSGPSHFQEQLPVPPTSVPAGSLAAELSSGQGPFSSSAPNNPAPAFRSEPPRSENPQMFGVGPLSQQKQSSFMGITSLFQRLVTSGIITLNQDAESVSSDAPTPPPELKTDEDHIPEIRLNIEDLRKRHDSVINKLYQGTQCSSCGLRFYEHQKDLYRDHLDWHFRANKREKENKRVNSRPWYFTLKEWLDVDDIADMEEKETGQSAFFQSEKTASKNAPQIEGEEGSCAVNEDADDDDICDICCEPFEQYWDENLEEWRYKSALRVNGRTYHINCYSDSEPLELESESESEKETESFEPSQSFINISVDDSQNQTEDVSIKAETDVAEDKTKDHAGGSHESKLEMDDSKSEIEFKDDKSHIADKSQSVSTDAKCEVKLDDNEAELDNSKIEIEADDSTFEIEVKSDLFNVSSVPFFENKDNEKSKYDNNDANSKDEGTSDS